MFVFAGSALAPSIVAAVGGVVSSIMLALVAWREHTNKQLLREIRDLIDQSSERSLDDFKDALREILGGHPRRRRWYDS